MINEQNIHVPDMLPKEIKKDNKTSLQPSKQQQNSQSDLKKPTMNQSKEISPYKNKRFNKKHKFSPSKNIDPSQITSILKGKKDESAEPLTKKYKVTIDENLNLEHTLTNSEASSTNNDNGKKQHTIVTSPKKKENKVVSPNKVLINSHLEKADKRYSPRKSPTKLKTLDPELAILAKCSYTPINELGFSRNNSEENKHFCGVDINMNTEDFCKRAFSLSEYKDEISKYSTLSIDEWLQKGNELLEQKTEITKQIMAARIGSSYAHKVITDQINARAKALQIWKTRVEEQDKKFTLQMKQFLSEE